MELSDSSIKKIFILFQKKNFLYFEKKKTQEKFLVFQEMELTYILGK